MDTMKEFVLGILESVTGDDLMRATKAFAGLSKEEMQKEHGVSGKSRAQILAGYQAFEDKINAAKKWINENC